MKTVGLSKKIIAAAGAQFVALVVNLIASGQFDRVEWAQVVGIVLTTVLGIAAPPNAVVAKKR